MEEFCKIFESEDYGQILVMIELEDDNYSISLLFNIDGGTAKVRLSGFRLRESATKYFKSIGASTAEDLVQSVFDNL
jgi:hypothetical protein